MDQQNETVTIPKSEYEKLLASQDSMQSQIDWLTERVRLLTKQKFGSSSERSSVKNCVTRSA